VTYVLGIDTGGTFTDAVLLDAGMSNANSILKKAKSFTTDGELELGIKESIQKLGINDSQKAQISRVIISTTLATNSIVEGNMSKVGLITIGDKPRGEIATKYIKNINGKVNIKGRMIADINPLEAKVAVKELAEEVSAIAISGVASIRNPVLEIKVKEIANNVCNLPVMCGHEIVSDLGYLERTNTIVINVGLLPVIDKFVKAMNKVICEMNINAPVFMVKGDGTMSRIGLINDIPVDTVLSGPAASVIGAVRLAGLDNMVVIDMGGTTTDTGIVKEKRIELSLGGAEIGNWKIRVKAAKLHTIGLGGDSIIEIKDGIVRIGPYKALPVCRGGNTITLTDILHYTNEYVQWDRDKAVEAVINEAFRAKLKPVELVEKVKDTVSMKIVQENEAVHKCHGLPLCAIGAPAETWYTIVHERHNIHSVIPKHFEVANAVGAAIAGIFESESAIIRQGEEGRDYLLHTREKRQLFFCKEDAIDKAIEVCAEKAKEKIEKQGLMSEIQDVLAKDKYMEEEQVTYYGWEIKNMKVMRHVYSSKGKYLETHIEVSASGKMFRDTSNGD